MLKNNYPHMPHIKESIDTLLHNYTAKHSKVLAVRFDIRYPVEHATYSSNNDISKFISKTNQKLKRHGLDPAYIWVREQNNSQHPHYHCAILLNGHKTKNPQRVFTVAENLWKSTIDSEQPGLIHHCNISKNGTPHENGIMIRKDHENYQSRIDDVKRQLSYLAKAEHKGQPRDGMRNFGMSRI